MPQQIQDSPIVQGNAFGEVWPPRAPRKLPDLDPRTIALRTLGRYIANLTFWRTGARGGPQEKFSVAYENFYCEQPDVEQDMVFPSVAVVGGLEQYGVIGLTSHLDEATRDKFGFKTVVQTMYEHTENITLECWASSIAERRALLGGLSVSLVPTEQMYGIRFRMPDYYDQTVCFSVMSAQRNEEVDAVRGRCLGKLQVEMRFNVVALVNYETLLPVFQLNVQDDPTFELVGQDG